MKRLLILPLPLILVSYVTSSCSSYNSDKAQNDSIAAAELEAARLDSIRQDSINRRNFITPDLTFNDLHGDVKICEVDPNHCYTYDEKGTWTNTPTWSDYAKKNYPEIAKKDRVVRDDKGRIVKIFNDPESDYEYDSYNWVDGKLAVGKRDKFNELGFRIFSEYEGFDGKDPASLTVYYDYIIDSKDNWIERKFRTKSFDPNFPEHIDIYDGSETRKITYYKNHGNKTTKVPNSPEQLSILNSFAENEAENQRMEQEEREKEANPSIVFNEMIKDYAWVCTGTMTTYQGICLRDGALT